MLRSDPVAPAWRPSMLERTNSDVKGDRHRTTTRDVALELLRSGMSVIPVRPDGSKAPALPTWKRFQSERMTESEAAELFDGNVGLAIVGGSASGNLEIIDVEDSADQDELFALIEQALPGLAATLPMVRTPSGGLHIYYRCETIEGNQKLAQRTSADGRPQVLMETRGQGGYVVGPYSPAACHKLGKTYDLLPGVPIDQTPTITPDGRETLHNCCRRFNTWHAPEKYETARSKLDYQASPGGRPGDDFNERGEVLALLQSHGHNIAFRDGAAVYLTRNGKKPGDGHGLVWHEDTRILYVFSTNAFPFEPETAYRPFQIYALLEHSGDFRAAARKLKSQGYGAPSRLNSPSQSSASDNRLMPAETASSGAPAKSSGSISGVGRRQEYLLNSRGEMRPNLANAITMLHEPGWDGVLAYDQFAERATALEPPPWASETPPQWGDQEDRKTSEWMQHKQLNITPDIAGQACQTVAREHVHHPVRGYLGSLVWDGVPRLVFWAERYLGAGGDPYTQAVSKCWILSAVARVYEPGCKVDHLLILEGPQGAGKSSALRILADPWFSDELSDLGSKDAAMQTKAVWIIELSELDSLARSQTGAIKAFISRSTDRYRPPYGKHVINSPRQCIFAGTVNHGSYLRDETGGRRFWPIKCGRIDLDALERDRDQLWAEAVHLYRGGAHWWLETKSLNALAAAEQAQRYDGDAWEEAITPWLENPQPRSDESGHPLDLFTSTTESVTVGEILTHCIGKRKDQWTQGEQNRIARILQALNWERRKQRTDNGKYEWRYRPSGKGEG